MNYAEQIRKNKHQRKRLEWQVTSLKIEQKAIEAKMSPEQLARSNEKLAKLMESI